MAGDPEELELPPLQVRVIPLRLALRSVVWAGNRQKVAVVAGVTVKAMRDQGRKLHSAICGGNPPRSRSAVAPTPDNHVLSRADVSKYAGCR